MVPGRSVGRPTAGAVAKVTSATALRAYVACRLEGRSDETYLRDDLGLALSTTAVRRAAGPRRWRPPNYRPPGRPAVASEPEPEPASGAPSIRDWLVVDAPEFGLGVAVISVVTDGRRAQRVVYAALGRLVGVVHVMAIGTGSDPRVLARLLADGEDDRRRLRAQLDEIVDDWRWDDIDMQSVEPAVPTWRRLAQAAARREGLLRAAEGHSGTDEHA